MKVLYFAWLKTRTGVAEEEVTPPAEVRDVAGLVDWLRTRSDGHAKALSDLTVVRCAVNHEHTGFDHPIGPEDEIALFPPVTGG
ncbi:MAG: molybdopterin converting factor subunit 1 [Alphaproteobacteria bacterium]|nr:molybdopterin converting factor subunit 1 [Alphaproteobacteria bacterium]